MSFLPPLPMLLSSASTDAAKVALDLKGWDFATELLQRHGLVPTSGWGKSASALGLVLANGILDWHMHEDTPTARFVKEILRDIPSEYISRILKQDGSPALLGATPTPHTPHSHPIFQMDAVERTALLERIRTMDHPAQLRLRMLLGKLQPDELKVMAHTEPTDLGTLLDILAPQAPNRRTLGELITAAGDRLAHFLVPNL